MPKRHIVPKVGDEISKPEGCVENTGKLTEEEGKARLQVEQDGHYREASVSVTLEKKGDFCSSLREASRKL